MPSSTRLLQTSTLTWLFLFWTGWGSLALVAAWTGAFHWYWFAFYTIAAFVFFIYKIRNKFRISHFYSLLTTHYSLLLLLSLLLASFFQLPTLFSGRDEGSISQAAIELARQHSLTDQSPEARAFFEIYGEGKALNFPGFYYTGNGALISQFPTGYIAWLASFVSIFGIFGLPIANAVLLFLFFTAFTRILKRFVSPLWVWIGTALAATSFPLFWFPRFTLSENFALAFLWVFLLALSQFAKHPSNAFLALTFLSGALLLFGRIEGFAFAFLGALFLFTYPKTRKFLLEKPACRVAVPLGITIALFALSLPSNSPFYITIAKAFLQNGDAGSISYAEEQINRLSIFGLYGIIAELVLGITGIAVFARKGKEFLMQILPFIITFPVFLYLLTPFISDDHPWMLRRYMFAIIPVCIYFSALLFSRIEAVRSRNFAITLAVTALALHLPAAVHFFPIMQGRSLIHDTFSISQNTDRGDLVLVDRETSGDGWHMLPGPLRALFGRHAVYFFNPEDFPKLNTQDFDRVLLLVPQGRESFYGNILTGKTPVQSFTVKSDLLESPVPLNEKRFPNLMETEHTVNMYEIETVQPS